MNENAIEIERRQLRRKKRQKQKRRHILCMVFGDIILVGIIICTFAMFHHVIPKMKHTSESRAIQDLEAIKLNEEKILNPEPVTTPLITEPVQTPQPEDNRSEWQKRFEDKFSEEVIATDTSYSSPNISVAITKHDEIRDDYPVTYYLADIYISSIDCLKTGAAGDDMAGRFSEDANAIANRNNAVLQLNGDYSGVWKGFLVRNGITYSTEPTEEDICVIFKDGSMKTYSSSEYEIEDILADDPYQTWRFGPQLLDKFGAPLSDFNTTWAISNFNPRAAIGFYEPGHYVFLYAEGRTNTSRGLKLSSEAQIFYELGCKSAYNLDGGASAVMSLNGKQMALQSTYRELRDTVIIAEPTE